LTFEPARRFTVAVVTGLRISQAVAATGVPATTLRYWEQIGLLESTRTPAGYRSYDARTVERLRFISAAKRLDLSLEAIRDLVAAWEDDTCRSVKNRMRPLVAERITDAERASDDLAHLASTLRASLERLDRLPDRDTHCDPSCTFLGEPDPLAEAAPVACSLTGPDRRAQVGRWRDLLGAARVTRASGIARIEVQAESAEQLVALVRDEQSCCAFFGFRLEFHGPTLTLTVTAPGATGDAALDDLIHGRDAEPTAP
jgi:DNA-binding transcriptional MerR regulator